MPRFWSLVVPLLALGCSNGAAPSAVQRSAQRLALSVQAGPVSVELRLERNDHLFAPGFTEQLWERGALRSPSGPEMAMATDCYYQGHARAPDGTVGIAAVNTCGLDGAPRGWIQLGDDWIRLDSDEAGQLRATRWRGTAHTPLGAASVRTLAPASVEVSRQALSAPTKHLELLALSDHYAFAREKGETLQTAADSVNAADALLRNGQLSPVVQLTLSAHVTFVDDEPWASGTPFDGDATITAIRSWLAQPGSPTAHDETFLFTGGDLAVSDHAIPPTLSTGAVGLALIRGVCTTSGIGIVEDNWDVVGYRGMVLAHELGHAFSLDHDTGIMSASAGQADYPTTWSSNSITAWSAFFSTYYGTPSIPACLENAAVAVGVTCGDGVVNAGEQCDCASSDCSVLDPCCDGATCQFAAGAQCSTGDACCQSCQLAPADTLCRAGGACAVESTCNGISAQCPEINAPVGTVCTSSPPTGSPTAGACYGETCVSATDQCTALGGMVGKPQFPPSAPSPDCTHLYCNDAPGLPPNQYWSLLPLDGTPCGTDKVCVSGVCTLTSSLPVDGCPLDPLKTEPGACGCGVSDQDTDLDEVADCLDACPANPSRSTEPCDAVDAGSAPDAGGSWDAGSELDAGTAPDAGSTPDAGGSSDAGVDPDGGGTADAGAPDAGASDAGAPVVRDAGSGAPLTASSGCSASGATGAGTLPFFLLFGLLAVFRRSRA